MDAFIVNTGDQFEWKQPKAIARLFELKRGEDLFGTLEFRSFWGTLAFSKDPVQNWSFKRVGFLNPQVTVRMPGADSDYALFFPRLFSGGILRPPDGRLVNWEPLNFWRTEWQFSEIRGFPILSFHQRYQPEGKVKFSEIFKIHAHAKVESNHITNLEFSILVNLGFYLLVMQAMDSAAIAAASS